MKFPQRFFKPAGVIVVLACVSYLNAADTPAKKQSAPPPPDTDELSVTNVPKSVFTVPASRAEGRDPFFPKASEQVATPKKPGDSPKVIQVVLQGISGSPERRIAIINTINFAAGEEYDVPVSGGRLRVRCIEIGTNSAVVEINGERRELQFRPKP